MQGFRTVAISECDATGQARFLDSSATTVCRVPEQDAPGNAGFTFCFHSYAWGPASLS